MPFYKLVPSTRSDHQYDEVVFDRDDNGDPKSIGVNYAAELTDEEVGRLREGGYRVVEAPEPDESDESHPVGSDVAGMSPLVGQTDQGPTISQSGTAETQTRPAPGTDVGVSDQDDESH